MVGAGWHVLGDDHEESLVTRTGLPTKLNLGCGTTRINGFTGVDYLPLGTVDVVHDLNQFPYPWPNGSVQEVLMDNVLEHLDDVVAVMEEIYRILIPGGRATIIVPYAKSEGALVDPTHKHFFTERSMEYFDGESEYSYYSTARFSVQYSIHGLNLSNRHRLRNLLPFRRILRYFLMNMYDELRFTLTKVEPA
jgi:SAM-dependent methyltransferase